MLPPKYLFILLLLWTATLPAQQVPDPDFEPTVDEPRYGETLTATVGIDDGHHNLHQLAGGFAAFGKLLSADGYTPKSMRISSPELAETNIFVIANPIDSSNLGNWKRPIAPAFSTAEVDALEQWVKDGGSLLVIADHMPFAGATNTLAERFGFRYADGFVIRKEQSWPPDTYSKRAGNLYEVDITAGIDSLVGFTGSALLAPPEATAVAGFPATHELLLPEVAWQFDENTERKAIDDYVLGAYQQYGKGKVAFFTEAAMFTAQIVQDRFKVGMNSPRAPQNQRFVLNLLHWLDNGRTQARPVRAEEVRTIVDTVLTRQGRAYEANDMAGVASYYTQDGIIYEPTGAELRGMASIIAYWRALKGNAISWKYRILETEEIGDQILAVCRFDISFRNPEGNTLTARSKALLTLKSEDGHYRIFRDFYMPVRG